MNAVLLLHDLKIVKELVYEKCGLVLTSLKLNAESTEYAACSFKLNELNIEYRVSKITPTKVGQFVAIWKRNADGITEPFDISDNIDFIVITAKNGENMGQFIFPKRVLAEKGIMTQNGKIGKRGIRVYPIWDIVTNKQAEKTKSWQIKYFLEIKKGVSSDQDRARHMFNQI